MAHVRFKATAAVLALPLWLGACAVARPPASTPLAAPPAWQAPLPHAGQVADLSRWWEQQGDALLVELIEQAQQASPSLASARARIEQARAARVGAQSALQPSVNASASAVRGNNQPPLPLSTTVQAGVQASWEIDMFGAGRAAADAAQARLGGAQAGWHDARVSVAAETASAYVSWRACALQLAVAENDARSRGETARLTQLSADAGFAAPASASLARASAAESSARLKQQRAQCEGELKGLVALTAVDEPGLRQRLAASAFDLLREAPLTVQSVPAEALAQRPDVLQAELAVAAASADVGAAQADRYPRLSLSGSIAAGRVRIGGGSTNAQTWAIGPLALSLPVFDAGRRAANVDAARAAYDEAVSLYRARVRQAVSEVERALVTLDSARSRLGDARTAAEGFQASFVATEARYRSGLASLVELEDARRT
ncbi:MAG TPA: efflux transporter outer membrane subunit, partial [Ramlibacter sp.]|nr:efflux transporter outer membrane subunit [Ramlibacter sp.]